MAKQDIKEYIEGRLKTLLDECFEEHPDSRRSITEQIREVLRMASHFGIRTRDILDNHSCGSIFKK